MKEFFSKIVGVTHSNPDGSNRQQIISSLVPGEKLHLVNMASERFPEAIGVFDTNNRQCGFLSKDLAESLRDEFPNFESISVQVSEVTGGGDYSFGCNIKITPPDVKKKRPSKSNSESKIVTKLVKTTGKTLYGTPRQETLSYLHEGETLFLSVDADDPDSPSIVVTSSDGEECGFLPKSVVNKLLKIENVDPEEFPVTVLEISIDENDRYGCVVEIDTSKRTSYNCRILVKEDNSLYVKTPLLDIPLSIFSALSVGEHLQVKDDPAEESVCLFRKDGAFVGCLPSSVTHQMHRRNLDLTEVDTVIDYLYMDEEGHFCKVILKTGAPIAAPSPLNASESSNSSGANISANEPAEKASMPPSRQSPEPEYFQCDPPGKKSHGCIPFIIIVVGILFLIYKFSS